MDRCWVHSAAAAVFSCRALVPGFLAAPTSLSAPCSCLPAHLQPSAQGIPAPIKPQHKQGEQAFQGQAVLQDKTGGLSIAIQHCMILLWHSDGLLRPFELTCTLQCLRMSFALAHVV